jgi:hypothetical protein
MLLSCELQLPNKAYEHENNKRISVIEGLTGIKINQQGKTGFTLGILTSGDVYSCVYSDNPIELLKLLLALKDNSDFILEFGTDEFFESNGTGFFYIEKGKFHSFIDDKTYEF